MYIGKYLLFLVIVFALLVSGPAKEALSQDRTITIPRIPLGLSEIEEPSEVATTLEILFFITILTLAPTIVLMMTSFTRIVIVLSFVRQAVGLQQIPAAQVVIGLSLFMTLFLMQPIGSKIYTESLRPYLDEELGIQEAFQIAVGAMREFMFNQTRKKDLQLFHSIASGDQPAYDKSDISTLTLIPAFVISELNTAFQMAFLIYIPFLILDLIMASILMSLGLLLLPPVLISLPFKLVLFVAIDGWNILVTSILRSFNMPL